MSQHGGKLCPNKENKEESTNYETTSSGLLMAPVASSNQAIQKVLLGDNTGVEKQEQERTPPTRGAKKQWLFFWSQQ